MQSARDLLSIGLLQVMYVVKGVEIEKSGWRIET